MAAITLKQLAFGLAAVSGVHAASTPTCKNDSGSSVDFTYAFKYPGNWEYATMDADHKLSKSSKKLTEESGISKTIMQMHDSGVSYVLWNDQPPPSKDSSSPYAHMKGLIIFTSSGGIWLTHSLPHFPTATARSASGLWNDASDREGQSFLCITLTADELHKLSPVMSIDRPVVYATKWARGDEDNFSDIVDWAENKKWDESTMTKQVTIESTGGTTFHLFGKSGNWGEGKDLYGDLVAPAVGKLYMEGWRCGRGVWGPQCGKDEVLDVLSVSFPERDWETTTDHSKWAVEESGTTFCVGDINRADGQDKRGGGTVCIHDSSLASQMRKVIKETDKCRSEVVV